MDKKRYEVTEIFMAQSEGERRQKLQKAVDDYLIRTLQEQREAPPFRDGKDDFPEEE